MKKIVTYLLLFLLPTQLAFHFWYPWAFVFGIRVDLLAPALYLTDILVFILILLNLKIFKDFKKCFLIILIFSAVNIFYSTAPFESMYRWLKILEFSFVAFYFAEQKWLKISSLVQTTFTSLTIFSLIGILQFINNGTLGGALYYLGERNFNMGTPGIALVSLLGREYLRAYSTFSHPNSLAGFFGASILFILLSGRLKMNTFNLMGVLSILVCFVLTFSLSAYLGVFLIFSFYLFSGNRASFKWVVVGYLFSLIIGSLSMPIISSWLLLNLHAGQNINQRLDLAIVAGKMISQKFLIGEGLGTFPSHSWLLQPVHNIFLLVFSEVGVFGLLAFCFLIYKTLTQQIKTEKLFLLLPLIFVLFTGCFDHYWLTLQQNQLLVSILFGLSFKMSTWKEA